MVFGGWDGRPRNVFLNRNVDDQFVVEHCISDPDPRSGLFDPGQRATATAQRGTADVHCSVVYHGCWQRGAVFLCTRDLRRADTNYGIGKSCFKIVLTFACQKVALINLASIKPRAEKNREPKTMNSPDHPTNDSPSWFEKPASVRLLIGGLVLVCVLLGVADLFYKNDHAHFDIERTFAFQAWFGFVTFVVIVFLGIALRPIIKRDEDYYDR